MMKPPDFNQNKGESQSQGISPTDSTTMTLLERQNENLLVMVKQLEAEKELLFFSMSELDTTLEITTRTLEISEKLNAAYEYIMKQHGFSFNEMEVSL